MSIPEEAGVDQGPHAIPSKAKSVVAQPLVPAHASSGWSSSGNSLNLSKQLHHRRPSSTKCGVGEPQGSVGRAREYKPRPLMMKPAANRPIGNALDWSKSRDAA